MANALVQVESYNAYDEKNNLVATVTAPDALEEINPADVESAVEDVVEECATQKTNFGKALEGIGPDSQEAINMNGRVLSEPITQIEDAVSTLDSDMESLLSPMIDQAYSAQNELQTAYNSAAYNQAKTYGTVK